MVDNRQMEIILLGQPVGKGRARSGNGHHYTPQKTRDFETALAHAARCYLLQEFPANMRHPFSGALRVKIEARMQIPNSATKQNKDLMKRGLLYPTKKPDFDNLAKTIDALNGIIWNDDSQIVSASIKKVYHDTPALIVRVMEQD